MKDALMIGDFIIHGFGKVGKVTAIAACHNEQCPSHKNCLRWQIGKRNPDIIAGNFAPKSRYSQRCGDWKKGGGL